MDSSDEIKDDSIELQLRITPDDRLAWFDHYVKQSPYAQERLRRRQYFSWAIAVLLVAEGVYASYKGEFLLGLSIIIFGLALALDRVLFYPNRFRKAWKKLFKRNLQLDTDDDDFGECTIALRDGQLITADARTTSAVPFDKLGEIIHTPSHLFIEFGKSNGFIVPKKEVGERELTEFENVLREKLAHQKELKPTINTPAL